MRQCNGEAWCLYVITYSALFSSCEKGKESCQARELFEAVQRRGVVPYVITYSALISACEKGEESSLALKLFGTMQQRGVVP